MSEEGDVLRKTISVGMGVDDQQAIRCQAKELGCNLLAGCKYDALSRRSLHSSECNNTQIMYSRILPVSSLPVSFI